MDFPWFNCASIELNVLLLQRVFVDYHIYILYTILYISMLFLSDLKIAIIQINRIFTVPDKKECLGYPRSHSLSTLFVSARFNQQQFVSCFFTISRYGWWGFPIPILCKGGFLSESEIRFLNLQNKLLQITSLNLEFEISVHNSKQLIQISSSG